MVEALPQERQPHPGIAPRGFTLTELLIAAALSLVIMAAIAGLFDLFGRSVRQSQATVELGSLMRSAAWQLRQDLTGVTCPVAPWLSVEQNAGYFELIEGPARDGTYALDAQSRPTANLTADTDDILLFTTQSLAGPFVGRSGSSQIESPYAEVAWFCRRSAEQPVAGTTLYDLHRRQLLVINYLGRSDLANNALSGTTDRSAYDLSLRTGTVPGMTGSALLPNSLGDLTKRENRFLRCGYSFVTESGTTSAVPSQPFPHAFPVDATHHALPAAGLTGSRRAWEDVVLTRVVAFDVRVFDPQVFIPEENEKFWRLPGDPGYPAAASQADDVAGAYVDLGWSGGSPVLRSGTFPPAGRTALQSAGLLVTDVPRRAALPASTYDTWSRHYESNGVDDDGDGTVDEGTGSIDYTGTPETSPPYPVPLRGLEVRLRVYEPVSQQVRQITIRHSFLR